MVQGVLVSHVVSITYPGCAWWKSKPAAVATGISVAFAVGTFSQIPLLR